MWEHLLPHSELYPRATHAVYFSVVSNAPSTAVHLAFTLLKLTYDAQLDFMLNDYEFDPAHIPRMRHLAYAMSRTGVSGAAYFSDFEIPYRKAVRNSAAQSVLSVDGQFLPLTTWPPLDGVLLNNAVVERAYDAAL